MRTAPARRSHGPLGLCAAAAALLPGLVAASAKDLGGGWEEKQNEEGKVVQQLKIEAPAMTEEDQYGYVMPERYRCDSCKAVMFHLDVELRKKQPKSRRLKEWEYTDLIDDACRGAFGGYGIKLIDGENALSGPGLPRDDKLAPGSGAIQMSSENWSKRLGELCREIVYEKLGEEELYEKFYTAFQEGDAPGLSASVCSSDLRDCRVGPKPPKKKVVEEKPAKAKKPKKTEKPKKAEKAKAAKNSAAKKESTDAAKAPGGAEEKVDVQTFLRSLAVAHGLTSDEYLASRTPAEWEKLTVAMAGRIFNKFSERSDSCSAKP